MTRRSTRAPSRARGSLLATRGRRPWSWSDDRAVRRWGSAANRPGRQPRSWRRVSSVPISRPCIGSPSPCETFVDLGVLVVGRRLDDRARPRRRIPRPGRSRSRRRRRRRRAASSARRRRGRQAAGGEVHDRQAPCSATIRTRSTPARRALRVSRRAVRPQLAHLRDLSQHRALVADRLDDVAGARLALGPDYRRASAMRRSASPRSRAPHTNGTVNAHLSMWNPSSAGVRTSDSSM